jgi:hypothetical protein
MARVWGVVLCTAALVRITNNLACSVLLVMKKVNDVHRLSILRAKLSLCRRLVSLLTIVCELGQGFRVLSPRISHLHSVISVLLVERFAYLLIRSELLFPSRITRPFIKHWVLSQTRRLKLLAGCVKISLRWANRSVGTMHQATVPISNLRRLDTRRVRICAENVLHVGSELVQTNIRL